MMKNLFSVGLSCALLGSPLAHAQQMTLFSGKVVSVEDGDTLTVQLGSGQVIHMHLTGTDAPDLDQPNGLEAKRALTWKTKGTTVQVRIDRKKDGSVITGDLFVGVQYINQEMIDEGWAHACEGDCSVRASSLLQHATTDSGADGGSRLAMYKRS
ncbi:MAG: thermonuclease family protein [Pontiellaceae bacterium]|nr:thermonuclease family protein [Pontiellaceae bacterium]MBN2783282.1 thermonuclease family protein [Pontiellaceae bacterium]